MYRPHLQYLLTLWACLLVDGTTVTGLSSTVTDKRWYTLLLAISIPITPSKGEKVLPAGLVTREGDQATIELDPYKFLTDHSTNPTGLGTHEADQTTIELENENFTSDHAVKVVVEEIKSTTTDIPQVTRDTDSPLDDDDPPHQNVDRVRQETVVSEVAQPSDIDKDPAGESIQTQVGKSVTEHSDIDPTVTSKLIPEIEADELAPPVVCNSGDKSISSHLSPPTEGVCEAMSLDPNPEGDGDETNGSPPKVQGDLLDGSLLPDAVEALSVNETERKANSSFVNDTVLSNETSIGLSVEEVHDNGTTTMNKSLLVVSDDPSLHDPYIKGQTEPDFVMMTSQESITDIDDLVTTTKSGEQSLGEEEGIKNELQESATGGSSSIPKHELVLEDTLESSSTVDDTYEQTNSTNPKNTTGVSFEHLEGTASNQSNSNAVQEAGEAEPERETPDDDISDEPYFGFPWGVTDRKAARRIPDMELLYRFFKDRMNADSSFHSSPQAEARFPLSMGSESQDTIDDSSEVLRDQESIDELLDTSTVAVNRAMGSSEQNATDSNDDFPVLESNQSHEADDLRELFEGVHAPDELDVGAASGSSMQEFIMGKSKEIIIRRVILCIKSVQRFLISARGKLIERFARPTGELNERYEIEHGIGHADESHTDHKWKLDASSVRRITQSIVQDIIGFFHNIVEGDEDAGGSDPVDIIGEDMDLDAIRKMSGLQL